MILEDIANLFEELSAKHTHKEKQGILVEKENLLFI